MLWELTYPQNFPVQKAGPADDPVENALQFAAGFH
jgi:hypothetical protein